MRSVISQGHGSISCTEQDSVLLDSGNGSCSSVNYFAILQLVFGVHLCCGLVWWCDGWVWLGACWFGWPCNSGALACITVGASWCVVSAALHKHSLLTTWSSERHLSTYLQFNPSPFASHQFKSRASVAWQHEGGLYERYRGQGWRRNQKKLKYNQKRSKKIKLFYRQQHLTYRYPYPSSQHQACPPSSLVSMYQETNSWSTSAQDAILDILRVVQCSGAICLSVSLVVWCMGSGLLCWLG